MPRYTRLLSGLVVFLLAACRADPPEADLTLTPQPESPSEQGESVNNVAAVLPDNVQTGETLTATPRPAIVSAPILSETPLPDVTLDVELFYSEHWMRVRQTIALENTSADVWDEVVFNIPLNWLADTFYLDAASVKVGSDQSDDYPFLDQYETVLRVPLPRAAQPGDQVEIELRYRVVIPPVASTDWPPTGTTGWTFDLIQAGEWYPALVPYRDGEGWYTWEYHPVGDPTVYPLVNTHLNVTCDDPAVTIASGGFVGREGNTWKYDVQAGRGIAFLASDSYVMAEREVDGIPVRSFYLSSHEQGGQAALDIAVEALALYSDLYGPYPYEDLTVAENGFFGGMEYSALISITDYAYYTYQGQPPSILHALVAHEVAHQWWYGAVGNDQAREPWLDESLAFYSELLYFEYYHPDLVDWWWVKRVDQYHPQGPVDVSIYAYEYSSDFILWMYGRAARFMQGLRTLMGDEAFLAFLQDYYATYSGQLVTARDFFTLLDAHTDQDYRPLLDEYFSQRFISELYGDDQGQ